MEGVQNLMFAGSLESDLEPEQSKSLAALRYCFECGLTILPRGEVCVRPGAIKELWGVYKPCPDAFTPAHTYWGDTLADAVSAYQEALGAERAE